MIINTQKTQISSVDGKDGEHGPKAINEGIYDIMKKAFKIDEKDYVCTPYFHIAYEETKLTCDFPNFKWHTDQSDYADCIFTSRISQENWNLSDKWYRQ